MAETNQKPKRRIRKIETVRETTVKTTEAAEKTSKGRQIWHGFTAPARAIGRGIAKVAHGLARFKVFRIIGRILLPRYFRNSWKELRQVTWLTFKQSRQLTMAVVMFAVIFGVLVALLDFGLDKIFKQVLIK
ncbi:MAG: preprotein translocase subunit SecE [Candidatus Saccharibacteria bacterium]